MAPRGKRGCQLQNNPTACVDIVKALHDIIELILSHSSHLPGDSRSWESPEKADNVWRLFIQILLR